MNIKKITEILLIIILSSCVTTNNKSIEEISQTDGFTEFTEYGKSLADIPSIISDNNYSDDKSAVLFLETEFNIHSAEELQNKIQWFETEGYRGHLKKILEYIKSNQLLLNSSDLEDKNLWQADLATGIIKESDLFEIKSIIKNSEYLSVEDLKIFDLINISILVKAGLATSWLTESEADYLYYNISLILTDSELSWYEIGRKYVSGRMFTKLKDKDLYQIIYSSAIASWVKIKSADWAKLPFGDIHTMNPELYKGRRFIPDETHVELPVKNSTNHKISLLFDSGRKTSDLLIPYLADYELYNGVINSNYEQVMKTLGNRNNKYHDHTNHHGDSIITEAVGRDIRILELLLKAGFNPDKKSRITGRSSLHKAVNNKEYNDIEMLIKYKADINSKDSVNSTPLCYAIDKEDLRTVSTLLKLGADPDTGFIRNYTPIGNIIRNNNIPMALEVLPYTKKINSLATNDWTLLHVAARYSDYKIIEQLLIGGADPNAVTEAGHTPLTLAIYRDDNISEVCNLLVKMGGDINYKKDSRNALLLYMSDQYTKSEKAESEAEFFGDFINLFQLSKEGNYHIERELGYSALWYLKDRGKEEYIDYYLENTQGQTFSPENSYDILRFLMIRELKDEFKIVAKRSEDLDYRIKNGWNILYLSYSDPKYYWASPILLEENADINTPGHNNESISHMLYRKKEYIKQIEVLDSGADDPYIKKYIDEIGTTDNSDAKLLLEKLKEMNL